MTTAAGPVVLLRSSPFFVGSERHSSCVAELNAVAEGLLWLAHLAEGKADNNISTGKACIKPTEDDDKHKTRFLEKRSFQHCPIAGFKAQNSNAGNEEENNCQQMQPGDSIIVTSDSMYVVNLLLGKCVAKENVLLAAFVQHLWRFVGAHFNFVLDGVLDTTTWKRSKNNCLEQDVWMC
jgi:hypothetical protein